MIDSNSINVEAAFDMLLEEIETEIECLSRIGSGAFEDRNYEKAKEILDRVSNVTEFRGKVNSLCREWQSSFAEKEQPKTTDSNNERRNLGRLRRGLRTREDAYYQPILEALENFGGSAQMSDALDYVFKKMRNILRDVDNEPLSSDPQMPRWRSTAQWARNSLVKDGMLLSNSPRGVWEISESGRELLKKRKQIRPEK